MAGLNFRTLTPDDFSQMYRSFIEAFSQYVVNMQMSKETFHQRMIGKLNLNYDLSPAAFDGDKLVGFIFHAVNLYEGKKTAYNGGTGVIPGYWGQQITKRLHEFIIPKLKSEGIERCLLEVITSNQQGINAYSKTGFSKTKHFKCFKLTGKLAYRNEPENVLIDVQTQPDFSKYTEVAEEKASMLDSFEQLVCNLESETVLEAYIHNELVGYIIFQPKIGRISQFGVKQSFRNKGLGSALIARSLERSTVKALTVINIEDTQKHVIAFLENMGFENQLDQWEMELAL